MSEEKSQPFPVPDPIKKNMGNKKTMMIVGVVVAVLIIILVILLLVSRGGSGTGIIPQSLRLGGGEVSEVVLTTEYENPFERDTQYVNPFNEYKSPFQALQ